MNKIIIVGILAITFMTISINVRAKTIFPNMVIRTSYKLIFHTDPSVLERTISSYLRKGYQPSGGVTVEDNGYYQVIYK